MKFTIELNAQEVKKAAVGGIISAIATLDTPEPGTPKPEEMPPAPPIRHTAPASQPFLQQPASAQPAVPTRPVDPATQQAMQPQTPVEQPAQAPPAPVEQSQPVVPTQAAAYTQEQLALAATQLMDANKKQAVLDLLAKYGVQALTMLPKEQYGAFATELRALGAKI